MPTQAALVYTSWTVNSQPTETAADEAGSPETLLVREVVNDGLLL